MFFSLLSVVTGLLLAFLCSYQYGKIQENEALRLVARLHSTLLPLSRQSEINTEETASQARNQIGQYISFYRDNSQIRWLKIISRSGEELYASDGADLNSNLDLTTDKLLSVLKTQSYWYVRDASDAKQLLLVRKQQNQTTEFKNGLYFVYAIDISANVSQVLEYSIHAGIYGALFVFILLGVLRFGNRRYNWITDKVDFEKQIKLEIYEHASYHDSLTGLPNRTMLLDRISHAIAKVDRMGDMLAVFFIDLDRFNLVNSSLGYEGGDQVICIIAERLRKAVRECDSVARINGDEFALLLDSISNINEAAYVARRIQKTLSTAFKYNAEEVTLSVSMGIAIYPNDSNTAAALLSNSYAAMQLGKDKGGAAHQFYTSDMNKSSSKRLREEKLLRDAVANDEYVLYYQPKINVGKCLMVGAEALIRWKKDNNKIIAPGKFISMLEESGLILPVGEWVLNQACRQAQLWNEQGNRPITIAVNVSARQFRQLNFVEVVYSAIEKSGLDPKLLEIEVTEGILMEDTKASTTTLEELKALGIRIAIDDFGTGYSSLNYLRRYPVDTLKIDRCFIAGIENQSEDAAIATTIVALAHNLKLNIVAEGVETQQQMAFLTALGCHELQGFLFSKPVAAPEFEKMLNNNALLFENIVGLTKNSA